MRKLVLFLWTAVILVIGLLFIQNQALYFTEQRLSLDVLVHEFTFPPLYNGAIILLFFLSGALLAAATSLIGRFKTHNALKKCKATGEAYLVKIGELKTQVDQLKSRCAPKAVIVKSSGKDMGPGGQRAPA